MNRPLMDARPVSQSRATLARWMGVIDANSAGFVHGGTVMKLCDEAAGLSAVKHSRERVVTAGVDRMTFVVPINVGELVSFHASVNAVWRTSMEVGVRVESENPRTGVVRHTNTAYFTMVAVDERGRPVQVPPLVVSTPDERRRHREAQLRRRNRLAERTEIRSRRDAPGEAVDRAEPEAAPHGAPEAP
jgi:acyl-CoA hydrolase